MEQLREFLRHQYIGAIVIGLLAYQGLMTLIPAITGTLFLVVAQNTNRSVLGSEKTPIPWDRFLQNFVQAALFLVLAWVMLRWLYAPKSEPVKELPAESAE